MIERTPQDCPPQELGDVGKAVLIATLSAVTAGIVTWGFEELKAWVHRKREEDEAK